MDPATDTYDCELPLGVLSHPLQLSPKTDERRAQLEQAERKRQERAEAERQRTIKELPINVVLREAGIMPREESRATMELESFTA